MKSVKILCSNRVQWWKVTVTLHPLVDDCEYCVCVCVFGTDLDVLQFLSLEVCDSLLQLSDAALGIVGGLLCIYLCLPINTQYQHTKIYLAVCVRCSSG